MNENECERTPVNENRNMATTNKADDLYGFYLIQHSRSVALNVAPQLAKIKTPA